MNQVNQIYGHMNLIQTSQVQKLWKRDEFEREILRQKKMIHQQSAMKSTRR